MKASIIDNFKLLFSDDYKVSDRDYKALSDTLASKGISEDAFESGLMSLVKILIDGDIKFPMTLKFLKLKWETDYVPYKFIDMISGLVKLGYIKVGKTDRDSKKDIMGLDIPDGEFEVLGNKVLIVTGSEKLDIVKTEVEKFINDKKRINESLMLDKIDEDANLYPSYVRDYITRLNTRYLKEFKINVSVESYVDEGDKELLSVIFHDTSDYIIRDKDIKKLADKYIKKVNAVKDIDVYKESSNELYMGLDVEKTKDYKPLLEPTYKFISELEINNA